MLLGSLAALSCTRPAAPPPAPVEPLVEPGLVMQVEIRRTEYGVPHITAENIAALGFGLAYCQVEDHGERVVMGLVQRRGELALQVGRQALDSDFYYRRVRRRALETYHLLSQDARDLMEGFAEGVNWYVRLHPEEFPDWVEPDFTGHDVHARFILMTEPDDADRVLRGVRAAEEVAQNEDGSNAWALAPSRTASGHAILLRNPHLSWNAGYYEVHLIVPGRLNFYGDVRVGLPLFYIGGFNERLGWATTTNNPDLEEVYELDLDPNRPDHYRFDGGSIPLQPVEITVGYKDGNTIRQETRTSWRTPLGPVVYRTDDKVYVLRSAIEGQFRMVDQYLGMMQADNLEEWLDAMRVRAHASSNFTYADADGNIFQYWNARLPDRPHESGGDSVAIPARRSSEIWTRLVPFDSLPMRLNPEGGYLHNENDPFYFSNLNEPFDVAAYGSGYPAPRLRLRSQLALEMIHTTPYLLSLEDVVTLKHTTRMLLADRVKDDLVAAVLSASPNDTVRRAIAMIEQWDNTTSPDVQGGVLFEVWFERYLDQTPGDSTFTERWARAFAEPWTAARPVETPRGLADPARAAEAFVWAIEETTRLYGRWSVPWGEVHRVRRGEVDVPVGGCRGVLGCFRTLTFRRDADGKLAVSSGDGWIFAVEFGDTPRAYSVLAYGQSGREDSPHYDDQAAMYAEGRLKHVAFTEEEIEAEVIRRYRPGRER